MSATDTSATSTPARSRTAARATEAPITALISAAASVSEVNGKRMYRTTKGQMVELPPDMTLAEAVALETEANEAEQKLDPNPAPLPVPDVEQKVKAKEKKVKDKKETKPKGKSGAGGKKGLVKPKGKAGAKAGKHVIKGKVGAWLMAKGAPVVARGQAKLQQLKTNEQKHEDAGTKLGHTLKAVVPPLVEGQSAGNTAQVTNVDTKPVPQPDEAKAKQALDQAILDNIPRSIEDVDNFKKENKASQMSAAVAESVKGDKTAVDGTFSDMKQEPPPVKSDVVPEPLPPEEIQPATPKMNLGTDTIAPLQKEHTDVSSFTKEGDAKLKEEGVTQEQLDMVDSGDLAEANKEKKGMEKKAKTEPEEIKQFAQKENKQVDKSLQQEEAAGREEIKNQRKQQLDATKKKQQGHKTEIEKKREEVANKINGIYKLASEKVTKKLADLETQSMARFDAGNAQATKEFETNVKQQMDAFKDRRYSGFWGWAKRAKDWLLGMDGLPEVKAIFDNNRKVFVDTIGKLTESITADNKKVIQECKDELAKARADIKAFVDKLGPDLRDAGQKAQEEMNGKLDALDQTVAKKEEDLANKLKDKQQAAIKAIDEKIEKMKEAMSGALAKLGALLLLAAKKFFTWALEKFGFSLAEIESIISKGAAVLKAIFTGPIQFVKNLVNAAITGFKNFGKNFLKHLKNALFEWLTGSLEGLILPQVWDFKGVISVALQMIGITYANMRRHMVVELGEPVVSGLEKTFTLVKTLVTEGPIAAWEQLKEMAGEMRDAFVDAVKDFIKTKIIEQAIQWLVSLFIPGAGIIKAIIGIYDTIVFFIQKAKQIMQMIGNFLSSIGEIAAGNIGAAADAMENGLARGLSLVINFLAQLLHLNGITGKIRDAIQKIRGKVDAVMAKVAKWIADKAKKLFAPVTKKIDQARAWGQKKIEQGKEWVQGKVDKALNWWRTRKTFKTPDGENHSMYFQAGGGKDTLMVATEPASIEDRVKIRRRRKISQANDAKLDSALDKKKKLDQFIDKNKTPGPDESTTALQSQINTHLDGIKTDLIAGTALAKGTDPPLSNLTYAKQNNRAHTVKAEPLSRLSGNTKGSKPPRGNPNIPPGWNHVLSIDGPVPTNWGRSHLVSMHFHGPGDDWNLTPGSESMNSQMRDGVEKDIKDEFIKDKDVVLTYETKVEYFKQSDPLKSYENDFPEKVTVHWGIMLPIEDQPGKYSPPTKLISKPYDGTLPGAPGVVSKPNINSNISRDKLQALFNGHQDLANAILNVKKKYGKIGTLKDMKSWLTAYYATNKPNVDFLNTYWKPVIHPKFKNKEFVFK